jgi:hypothetical protein
LPRFTLAIWTALALCFGFATRAHAQAPELIGFDHPRIGLIQNTRELGINVFRNPSIGLEGRFGPVSLHAGGYPTVVSKNERGENENTWFFKAGATLFFLPHILYGQEVSELYLQIAYVRGLNRDWTNGFMADFGYRFMIYKGINLRLGAALLVSPDHEPRINPTPGAGWSYTW